VETKTRTINRIQKVLEDANIKLASVASDVMDDSCRAMIQRLIGGETNPCKLADLAQRQLRGKIPDLEKALEGKLTLHHRFCLSCSGKSYPSSGADHRVGQRNRGAHTPSRG
jgi:hypothetical protein